MGDQADLLDASLATFEEHRDELVRIASGKFVLIHGTDIAGVFDNDEEALAQGYESFGNVPFLVKEITETDVPVSMMSVVIAGGTDA